MAKKKRKDIPFHIAHDYKQFVLLGGTKFWAKNDESALLYRKKILKLRGAKEAGLFTNGMLFKEIGADV